MARKKASTGSGASSEWLNTYADMVTLLLTFFILLFSMSSLDAAKFNLFVEALRNQTNSSEKIVIFGQPDGVQATGENLTEVPSDEPLDLEAIFTQLKQYIEEKSLEDKVEVSKGEGYVFIRFMDDMLFEPNSARLKQADLEILNFVGYGIKSVQDRAKLITIQGHTAAIPDNPNYQVSDRILSTDRANAVLMHFEDNIGIEPDKMVAMGWGKWRPFGSNDDEAGRSKNRRVEIVINTEDAITDQLDTIYERLID